MNRCCSLWLAVGLIVGVSLGSARAEDTLRTVTRRGVLVAGVADDDPPLAFRDARSGRLVGYDVDFVATIARRLGVRVEFRPVNESNRLSEILDRNLDILAGLPHSETRNKFVDFSDPYLVTGQKFLARRGVVRGLEDLEGKKVGAVVGTPSEGCARARCEGGRIVPFDDYVQGVHALRQGEIDAFTSHESILVDLLASLPRGDYEIPELLLARELYHLGVRKRNAEFLDAVNRAVREIQRSGEADRIRARWFAAPRELPPPAYGAVVRKAATRPRFLGLVLNGIFSPDAEVSIFALDGSFLGTGRICSVIGDEFYLDVAGHLYDSVRPGYLVTINMTSEMALDVLIRRRDSLKAVEAESEKEEEELRSKAMAEALEKDRRAKAMDTFREKTRVNIQAERARYYWYYGYGGRGYRYRRY